MIDRQLAAITDVLATTPQVMFCVKDAAGVYVAANQAFAERAGLTAAGDVVGKTARDLFPDALADLYAEQDEAVLTTGHMLSNELELITRPGGEYGWFLTSKSRWVADDGTPAGLVSVSVDLRTPADAAAPHRQLEIAVDVARRRFAEQLSVGELAEAASMTVSQLERTSRRLLGLSPKQLILRFRLEAALQLLETSDLPIADVADRSGYYDQSAFTRQFKRVVGTTPSVYRAARSTS